MKSVLDKLGSLLETSKASRLADKIYELLDSLRTSQQKASKKRNHDVDNHNSKKAKLEENGVVKDQSTKDKKDKDPNLSANQVI